MNRILLVEDNTSFATMLVSNLEREGFSVVTAGNGVRGLELARRREADLILLDLMIPSLDGYTVLQRLRDEGVSVPVLVMTARGQEDDKLRAFALGADDYVVKPIGLRELLARIRVLLRRAGGSAAAAVASAPVVVGAMTIDLGARTVTIDGSAVELRAKEFDLLAALVRQRGKVVTRADLLRDVWGYGSDSESRTLETHMATLRQRLGDGIDAPRFIVTVRRVGYRLGTG